MGRHDLVEETYLCMLKSRMNADMKHAFASIKPVCDMLMVCPNLVTLTAFTAKVVDLNEEVIQEFQQYVMFPLISRMRCAEIRQKEEIILKLLDALYLVLDRITISSFEMLMKLESGLLVMIFDQKQEGMVAATTEEVKLSAIKCLTRVMMHIPNHFKDKLLTTQVPLLAQTVFVSVHIAKLEKLRALRLAAIECVLAYTMTHPSMTVDYHIPDPKLELLVIDNMLSSILPGALAALQDVATTNDNQGHKVVVAAVEAIHRILCLPMHDKYLPETPQLRTEDFVKMVREKKNKDNSEVSKKDPKSVKDMKKRSIEWFEMAGEKLTLITTALCVLRLHDHFKVRKELAVFCYRVLTECSLTMAGSHPICLDVLIALTKDDFPEVSEYCSTAVNTYFASAAAEVHKTFENLSVNFISVLYSVPRVLNAIDNMHKLVQLNLFHGYMAVLCDAGRPQRLTAMLSVASNMQQLCGALSYAARHATRRASLARHATRDVTAPPPTNTPWSHFERLDSPEAVQRLQEICQLLGAAECSELILDSLLEQFRAKNDVESVYIMNNMASAPASPSSLSKRILHAYLEEDVWGAPLEVDTGEAPLSAEETLDATVYNPRAWTKDSVPDLYEGAVETRYTDISYATPRLPSIRSAHTVATVAEAQRNLVLSCLLTEGVGVIATRLGEGYQPYLLRTLCLILERVGSEYELLHLAGLKAINAIAAACAHRSVADLIKCNADYFTNQITVSLKKSWNCQSALQILSVVMEYSDVTILDCMYGIVEDVLVQSCDKYYEKNLSAYLQVFLTFVECINRWFPPSENQSPTNSEDDLDLLQEVCEYVRITQEAERMLSDSDFDSGKSALDMYKEDAEKREDDILDYDDKVTEEKPPLPQQVKMTISIVRRSVNLMSCGSRACCGLALRVVARALPALAAHEDALLPLVHAAWPPLVERFHAADPLLLRRAFDLLITLAALAKDFIQSRTVKEVLPEIYKFLHKSSKDSLLKDTGSYYRSSQAYSLQVAALDALPSLARDLGLEDESLEDAMASVDPYLSKKQPKPLQSSAVNFFKKMLEYEYGATWYHLRELCNNDLVLEPPQLKYLPLEPIVGTPFQPRDKDYEANVKLIFDFMVS